jgi:hypothetical protein
MNKWPGGSGRWFFRAIESAEGWTCRHGTLTYDTHPKLEDALDHLATLASADAPAEVFVHWLDGPVVAAATYD